MMLKPPAFIVFEGIDGSGKSTLADTVFSRFSARMPAVLLAEPTSGGHGKEIRRLLKEAGSADTMKLLELFILDREEDAAMNIRPALASGKLVIMDRYYHSNAAYQGIGDIGPGEIVAMNLKRGFPVPDRVYLVDLDPKTAMERIHSRKNGLDFFENSQLLEKIRANYLSLADAGFCVLDGRKSPGELADEAARDMELYLT
jgi:dTMP kinase